MKSFKYPLTSIWYAASNTFSGYDVMFLGNQEVGEQFATAKCLHIAPKGGNLTGLSDVSLRETLRFHREFRLASRAVRQDACFQPRQTCRPAAAWHLRLPYCFFL